jgi:hypothetical protein
MKKLLENSNLEKYEDNRIEIKINVKLVICGNGRWIELTPNYLFARDIEPFFTWHLSSRKIFIFLRN